MLQLTRLILTALVAISVVAQDNQPVQQIPYYSGSNLIYLCEALSNQPRAATISVSSVSNASPASLSATAHGLDYNSGATTTPLVKITGATGGWAGINGTWIATPTSANAFTIALDTSGFGSFSGQTLTVTTVAPLTTAAVWRIFKYVYDGSNNQIWSGSPVSQGGAGATALIGSSSAFTKVCANRATYGYQ